MEGDEDDVAEALFLLLTGVVAPLESVGSAEALAVLRVLEVYGPPQARSAAARAVARLVAAGVLDRPWAGRVGRPEFLRAWRYEDVFGEQTSLGVLTDRGRDHALTVLIDHLLGGGIKDAWVAEGRDATRLRARVVEGLAREPDVVVEDVDVAEAARVLLGITRSRRQPWCSGVQVAALDPFRGLETPGQRAAARDPSCTP